MTVSNQQRGTDTAEDSILLKTDYRDEIAQKSCTGRESKTMRERGGMKVKTRPTPWSDLPEELLANISEFLPRLDILRFRAVCKSWRSSVPHPEDPQVHLPLSVPYLTAPLRRRHQILLVESTVYHVSLPRRSLAASTSSSSWGWLLKLKPTQVPGHFHVLNSLSCPPTPRFPSYPRVINLLDFRVSELAKAYSLHQPNDDRPACKVVASSSCTSLVRIAAGILCHLKIGDETWDLIDDIVSQLDYEDVILYKNVFCAVDTNGRAVVIDSRLKVTEIASSLKGVRGGHRKILVESDGDLLLVDRYHERPYLKVYKLKEEEKQWVNVESLDGRIMFLGDDCSFFVAAEDFGNGCKGNCIFFNHRSKFTVFNLKDSSLMPLQGHPAYRNVFGRIFSF